MVKEISPYGSIGRGAGQVGHVIHWGPLLLFWPWAPEIDLFSLGLWTSGMGTSSDSSWVLGALTLMKGNHALSLEKEALKVFISDIHLMGVNIIFFCIFSLLIDHAEYPA